MRVLKKWGERWGSNPRPSEPQSDALPAELLPPFRRITKLTFFFNISIHLLKIFLFLSIVTLWSCSSIVRYNSESSYSTQSNFNKQIENNGKKFRGLASYFANEFHGRKTASGEIFDKNKMTAAHKTLPFGTIVKVTNLKNNLSVLVVINDRGPFVEGRIIDLSYLAAQKLDFIKEGVVPVEIEILD